MRKRKNLIEPIYYIPAKNGDTEAAKQLIQFFLDELQEVEEHFEPCLFDYVKTAFSQILTGNDASHALLLARTGQGNKAIPAKTNNSIKIAKEIHSRILRDQKITAICRDMEKSGVIINGKKIVKSESAFMKIYTCWREALAE